MLPHKGGYEIRPYGNHPSRSSKRYRVLTFQNQQFVADFEKFDYENIHPGMFSPLRMTRGGI